MGFSSPNIRSEIGRLRSVVIHAPGAEFDRMRPENVEAFSPGEGGVVEANPDYLLFDDLVLLPRLRREHRQLVEVLTAVVGEEGVADFRDLLRRTLFDADAREAILEDVVRCERETYGWSMSPGALDSLRELDPHSLALSLLWGVLPESGAQVCRWPSPNLLFARDIAAVVGDAIVLSYAARNARRREMLLARHVFRLHAAFDGARVIDIGESGTGDAALEGGDIVVLSDRVVAIGVGVRTNEEAVRRLGPLLFEQGVEVILVVSLPRKRSAMHLDTLFTRISEDACLAYLPSMVAPGETEEVGVLEVRRWKSGETGWGAPETGSLFDVLGNEGVVLTPVSCGGDDPIDQAREQWSDGANAFALAPGKIVCYARNGRTLAELNKAGFEVMGAMEFVQNAGMILADPLRKVVVTIEGSELSRGRGGPRCLTMAVSREG